MSDDVSSPGEPKRYGLSDDELLSAPTVFRSDLFAGQVVLVTGGGRGLGKAIAVLFARLGANLVICGRDEPRLTAAHQLLERIGVNVVSEQMSIRDPDAAQALVDKAYDKFGRVDVVVNNAGGQFPQAAIDYKPKGWNAVIDTNLNGTWYVIQAAARQWIDRNEAGNIINIASDRAR